MCKIIAIINKDSNNNDTINKILHYNKYALATQDDGYSVYEDGETRFFMGKEAYKTDNIAKNIAYKGNEIYMTHFRISTGGADSINGLHLQKLNDRFVFAHNGTVRHFYDVKTHSDSFYFFNNLLNSGKKDVVYHKKINKAILKYDFSGKGFLYDEENKDLHIFMNMKLYIYGLPNCLIFATYDIETSLAVREYKETLGMSYCVEKESDPIRFEFTASIDDHYMKFHNGIYVEKKKLTSRATRYHTNNNLYGNWQGNTQVPHEL